MNAEEIVEEVRVRIMQEAYDCADRGEVEAYNSVKVMCSDVLALLDFVIASTVRECADVAINNGCGDFVDIRQKLYERFGVEE